MPKILLALWLCAAGGREALAEDTPIFRLQLDSATGGQMTILRDTVGVAKVKKNALDRLPALDARYRREGDRLVPLTRGFMETDHPYFDWVLSLGRVMESGTNIMLPVALVEKNANCIHNGMIELQGASKTSEVSIRFESETCMYFQFDYTGEQPVRWTQDAAKADLLTARPQNQMPQRMLSELEGIDGEALGQPGVVAGDDMTVYGLVKDGVHYRSDCFTRTSIYAACDDLILPSYSLAKSLAAGLGLMRLEKLYPGAREALVADYIPACGGAAWKGVTFEHLLNMATGNYESAVKHADEDSGAFLPFFEVTSGPDKTGFSCSHFPHREAPGKRWVYHTSDTYLLGVAMNAYLSEQTGEPSDYYRDLLVPIWRDMGLSPTLDDIRRTVPDGTPFSGYGLVLHARDIALLGHLLASGDARFSAYFDADMLNAAMQRNAADRGLDAGGAVLRYRHGFWGWNARAVLGCKTDTWLPFFSGYGGISVVLLPGGTVYYYFSDGGVHAFANAVKAIAKASPVCGGMS